MTVEEAVKAYRVRVSGSHTPKPPTPFRYLKALKTIVESSGPTAASQATKEHALFLYEDAVKFAMDHPPATKFVAPIATFVGILALGSVIAPAIFESRELTFVTAPIGVGLAGWATGKVANSELRRWRIYLETEFLPPPKIVPNPPGGRSDGNSEPTEAQQRRERRNPST